MRKWERLSTEDRFVNPWWTYRFDTFRLPDGKEGEYHSVHTEGSVMVVPVLDDGRLLLVRQYRYLHDRDSIEFPCGGRKSGEEPVDAARRELVEETGHDGALEPCGWFNPFNGIGDESCHVFIARSLRLSDAHAADETEEIEPVARSMDEIEAMIRSNDIWDGMTMAAWTLARNRLIS